MKNLSLLLVIVFVLSFSLMPGSATSAQGTASVVDTTVDVPPAVRSAVDAWLAVSPPIDVPYYAITYVNPRGADTFVSLAALRIADPSIAWHITDYDTVVWMGSVLVHTDQSVTMLYAGPQPGAGLKTFAMPSFAPGGGSNIRFPWDAGKKMMYGESGIHDAGGGGAYAIGFEAVDLLGGNDLGSGVASSNVYAVFAGTVDYVCADAVTTLVRTVDVATDNYFIYAHLLSNANLVEDHEFSKGALIGTLKYGTFDNTCGWAEQTEKHYHLHFGFEMANSAFRMENCIINTSTESWLCGTKTISPGEYLMSSGAPGGGEGTLTNNPSFWDMALTGGLQLWNTLVIAVLPEHQVMQYTYVLYNTVKLMLRIAWVMVYSNVNLGHLAAVLVLALFIKAAVGIAELFAFLFKAYNTIFPKIPGFG